MESIRIENEPSFVLHAYPYRETSYILEIFGRNIGRVGMVARGARRPKSDLRGLLMPFQPLLLYAQGKGELLTLTKAEWVGGQKLLVGQALFCGFYLNEILLKLLMRHDAYDQLFDEYELTLKLLGEAVYNQSALLRRFEIKLLSALGYGLVLDSEAFTNQPIDPNAQYDYFVEQGPVRNVNQHNSGFLISGQTLVDMKQELYERNKTLKESRELIRYVMSYYLNGQPLKTVQLMNDLKKHK
ncbi:MAG: DNA repair protein RecO [Proteobacteria bacterium]|nr:DNA repair protein RecO [Pseudomonadota bacterium]MDE3208455.1 DNA repair protein RecO [Pseudomonadota bacterium]